MSTKKFRILKKTVHQQGNERNALGDQYQIDHWKKHNCKAKNNFSNHDFSISLFHWKTTFAKILTSALLIFPFILNAGKNRYVKLKKTRHIFINLHILLCSVKIAEKCYWALPWGKGNLHFKFQLNSCHISRVHSIPKQE